VVKLVRSSGWAVGNVDCTLVLEKPRIAPHVGKMRKSIAPILGVGIDAVSVKATTNEGMGFIGRGEGVCAHAVALLKAV
jgi:2-C-methyl-D-erythritol 2,4-cyclodiphosphate synthase